MMLIDRRERDFLDRELRRLDLDVEVTELEYADCAFPGNGESGECMVGCERKKLSDLVNSMKDRRLSGHQLRGMRRDYDYIFLFVESVFRPGRAGELEELRGRDWTPHFSQRDRRAISYAQLISYLTSLELCGNVIVRRTSSTLETAQQLAALYRWFNDKRWADHHAHDQIYSRTPDVKKGHGSGWSEPHSHNANWGRGRVGLVNGSSDHPSTLWLMAAQLPGVDRRAESVARHFRTVRAMANAQSADWMQIEGFGAKRAGAAVRAITEEGA